jgi:hypothetical protein
MTWESSVMLQKRCFRRQGVRGHLTEREFWLCGVAAHGEWDEAENCR